MTESARCGQQMNTSVSVDFRTVPPGERFPALEKFTKLILAETRLFQNLFEGWAWQIAPVQSDHRRPVLSFVPKDQMTSFLPLFYKPSLF